MKVLVEKRFLDRKKTATVLTLILSGIILTALTITITFNPSITEAENDFYLGIEVAYGDIDDLKAIVSEVKQYTNVLVLGLPEFSINRTLLDESCNFIYDSNLSFIVLFTNLSQYSDWQNYTPAQWVQDAKEKYGDKFLAVYRWDEPGGDQLDKSKYQPVKAADNHAEATKRYIDVLRPEIQYYQKAGQQVLTADYGLYWFDYMAGYDTVLAEFGWNNSRAQQIALARGAAQAFDKDWGVMITWTYSNYSSSPYIESPAELFNDLLLAYDNGAKYAIVFNYPEIDNAKYGILTQEHLNTLEQFWKYSLTHERLNSGYKNLKTAYVLPTFYGFGFRSASDTIWGLWSHDNLTTDIYNDVENLICDQGTNFDIIFDNSKTVSRYDYIIFWNGTTIQRKT